MPYIPSQQCSSTASAGVSWGLSRPARPAIHRGDFRQESLPSVEQTTEKTNSCCASPHRCVLTIISSNDILIAHFEFLIVVLSFFHVPFKMIINFLLFCESSYIPRRPQHFAKSSPYFWLALHREFLIEVSALHKTKVRRRFRKIFVAFLEYMNFNWNIHNFFTSFHMLWITLISTK